MDNYTPEIDRFARIRVVGVGGGGGNAVTRMVESGLRGVDFMIMNTDAQALTQSKVRHKIQIGKRETGGLGAGADPGVGMEAAKESAREIEEALEGSDMVFVTVGMGGGTGTGASPMVAEIAKDNCGALTVGVVTRPFKFEGKQREITAREGIAVLRNKVDTLIEVPNDKLLEVAGQDMPMTQAFTLADEILYKAVQSIADLITITGFINVDFADVKTIMSDAGTALIGFGEGQGAHRAIDAAENAINSPLLEYSIEGAQRILLNVTGCKGMTLYEVNAAAEIVSSKADENANIIFGSVIDETMEDKVRITVLATGFGEAASYKVPERTRHEAAKQPRETEAQEQAAAKSDFKREVSMTKDAEIKQFKESGSMDQDIPLFLREPGQ